MPTSECSQRVIESIKSIRDQAGAVLDVKASMIRLDILIAVMRAYAASETLNVKGLFAELPFSDMGLRYHFRELLDTGWIVMKTSDEDARRKLIYPTEILLQPFETFTAGVASLQWGESSVAYNQVPGANHTGPSAAMHAE